jgi:hypothetical protein
MLMYSMTSAPAWPGIFQLVSVDTTALNSRSPILLDTSFLKSLRGGGQSLLVRSLTGLEDLARGGLPYFSLPSSHTGNQIKSYGGVLRFQLSYRGEGSPAVGPLVIIQVA